MLESHARSKVFVTRAGIDEVGAFRVSQFIAWKIILMNIFLNAM